MEKTFNDMSADERVVYLVDSMKQLLWEISMEARKTLRPLGFTPEKATEFKLLALIEGESIGQHEAGGAMDVLEWLRYTLADKYDVEGLYESLDEDEEESEDEEPELFITNVRRPEGWQSEDESDELEEVEA